MGIAAVMPGIRRKRELLLIVARHIVAQLSCAVILPQQQLMTEPAFERSMCHNEASQFRDFSLLRAVIGQVIEQYNCVCIDTTMCCSPRTDLLLAQI